MLKNRILVKGAMVAIAGLALTLTVACGGKGGGAGAVEGEGVVALVGHVENLAGIIEKNAKDASAAESAVGDYITSNQDAMMTAQKQMMEKAKGLQSEMMEMKGGDPSEMMGKVQELMEKIGLTEDVMKRMQAAGEKIEKLMADNPDLAKSDKLKGAMGGLKQAMKGMQQMGGMMMK